MKRILLIMIATLMMVSCATTNQTSSYIKILDDNHNVCLVDTITNDTININYTREGSNRYWVQQYKNSIKRRQFERAVYGETRTGIVHIPQHLY